MTDLHLKIYHQIKISSPPKRKFQLICHCIHVLIDSIEEFQGIQSHDMLNRLGLGLGSWFRRKVVDPLSQILHRGTEPKQLAFSAALGITIGVFPICGVTVFLCGIAIAVLGSVCHVPTVMLANFIATPIELSLVFPFLRVGEFVTGGPQFTLTSDALKKVLTGHASKEVLQSIFHALLGWVVAAPFIFGTLYVLCVPCFIVLVRKFNSVPSSPKKPLNSPSEVRLKVRDA